MHCYLSMPYSFCINFWNIFHLSKRKQSHHHLYYPTYNHYLTATSTRKTLKVIISCLTLRSSSKHSQHDFKPLLVKLLRSHPIFLLFIPKAMSIDKMSNFSLSLQATKKNILNARSSSVLLATSSRPSASKKPIFIRLNCQFSFFFSLFKALCKQFFTIQTAFTWANCIINQVCQFGLI